MRTDSPSSSGLLPTTRAWYLFYAVSALSFLVYVVMALTPSSYGLGLAMLGIEPSGLWLGTPQAIRSDEWMVLTPYIQIAVANGLGAVNQLSPYQESLRTFQALPVLDWAMLFKPYHWGFLFLPAANAFSLYYAVMGSAFIAGWAIFLRLMRLPPLPALLVSLTLFFSPFVQAWWSSNSGVFALAPWVSISWLIIEHRWLRITACSYCLLSWMLANAYPPFLYSMGFAMLVMVLAFRRDRITLARCIDAGMASALALGLFVAYFHELIPVMQNTVYPGQRVSTAGGVNWWQLPAHLFPGLRTVGHEPLPGINSNASEIVVLSSLLPLCTLVLLDYQALRSQWKAQRTGYLWLLAGTLLMISWIFLYLPALLAKLSLLSMVPPKRALLALGMILNLGCAILLWHGGVKLNAARIAWLVALLLIGSAAKLLIGQGEPLQLYGWMDFVPYLCALLIALSALILRLPAARTTLVLGAALMANLLTYGLFNPVQSAHGFFDLDRARIEQTMITRGAERMADGTLLVPGRYGAVLAGAGLRTINHVLYAPQPDFFKPYFSSLPEQEFNWLFNRFEHVSITGNKPRLSYVDHVELPAPAFTGKPAPTPISLETLAGSQPPRIDEDMPAGSIDIADFRRNGELILHGWLRADLTKPVSVDVWTSSPLDGVSMFRFERPDVAAHVDPALSMSGANITLSFPADVSEATVCVLITDASKRQTTVHFPGSQAGCSRLTRQ